MSATKQSNDKLPPRFDFLSPLRVIAGALGLWLVINSFRNIGIEWEDLRDALPNMLRLLDEMTPPETDQSFLTRVGKAMLTTLQMALAGTVLGVFVSLPLGTLASRATTPHPVVYHLARVFISLFRTVPDLVWALFFVATVGLGPFAGMLTLTVDTIGFCGRFFAESMEEIDKGPQEALTALGARRLAVLSACVIPMSLPAFVNTALFSLEKAVRSSVVLGLVGAGGIGIELKVSMDTFRYNEAAAIILCIFILVIMVERISSHIRQKIL